MKEYKCSICGRPLRYYNQVNGYIASRPKYEGATVKHWVCLFVIHCKSCGHRYTHETLHTKKCSAEQILSEYIKFSRCGMVELSILEQKVREIDKFLEENRGQNVLNEESFLALLG